MSKHIDITQELSRRFRTMSFISAILVVALHTLSADQAGLLGRVVHSIVSGGVCEVAVPWFFFAAGFFLAGHFDECSWWGREVAKRFRTLLIPFWIWSCALLALNVLFALAVRLLGREYGGVDWLQFLSLRGVVRVLGFDYYDTMPTMWFLRTLFIFVFISPVLRRINAYVLLVLFLFSCLFTIIPWSNKDIVQVGQNLLSIRGLFYFCSGLYLRRHSEIAIRNKVMVILIGVVLSLAKAIFKELAWDGGAILDSMQLPFLMYAVYFASSKIRLPAALWGLSFPIYVTHMMIALCITAVLSISGMGGVGNITMARGGVTVCVDDCCHIADLLYRQEQIPEVVKDGIWG